MSQSSPQFVYTLVAGADLSTHKNKFAKVTADYTVGLATANTDGVVGVIDDIPHNAAGAQVAIRFGGTCQILAGAAFSAGAKVTPDATSRAIAAVATQDYHAIALQAATAAGDLIECFLIKGKLT
jgi:hypothetical protein